MHCHRNRRCFVGVALAALLACVWLAPMAKAQQNGPPVLIRRPPQPDTQPSPGTSDQSTGGPPVLTRTPPAQPSEEMPQPARPMAPPAGLTVTDYALTLEFDFPAHKFGATAKISFTPTQLLANAAFHLNENLVVDSVTDANGNPLPRDRHEDEIVVSFPAPLAVGSSQVITMHYAGVLADASLSPINGIRTAYVGPEGAFLLYPGEWFPQVAYGTDRFTATIVATLPAPMGLIASGVPSAAPQAGNQVTYTYVMQRSSFPGSVIVTPLRPQTFTNDGLTSNFYFSPDVPAALVAQYADSAAKIFAFMRERFGTPPTTTMHFVELPDDALPSFSTPNVIVLSKSAIGGTVNYNLLVDEISQQWWGNMVSPATLNDAWLQFGAARFCESLYVEQVAGKVAWKNLVEDLEVGALSYPDTALSNSASLYPFSPQFQDLNYDKGAMLFHMLRWQLGDAPLMSALQAFLAAHAWQPVTTQQFEDALEQSTHTDLRAFFTEWYHGTFIPKFQNQYTVYRLQAGGYRVQGTVQQTMDLFNMPVDMRIDTDAAAEDKTVDVVGTDSTFSFQVAGRPHQITIDPDNWILKNSTALQLRVAISRGDNDAAAGNFAAAIGQYRDALQSNPISSLAHYRLAETYFQEQNWQNAADEYRQAQNGDLDPSWVLVWSHIQLGKIFDLTGQRDRAVQEYQLAVQTHDDTQGALEVAAAYLKSPYKPPVVSTAAGR